MFFADAQRRGAAAGYQPASTAAVAALVQLREETFPQFIEPPHFIPRGRRLTAQPEWLSRLLRYFTWQNAMVAGVAAVLLIFATALPAWAALQQGGSVAPSGRPLASSSAGATGTASTRVADLSVATFVGGLPFVQHIRYLDALAGTEPRARQFVDGARQASLVEYLQDVSVQMTLPYLSDAVTTKEAVDTWKAAAAEAQRRDVLRAAAGRDIWGAPALAPGTRVSGAVLTFYSCLNNGFCGLMASGQATFAGAAACSTDLPFGTRFVIDSDPTGRIFVCADRGALAPTWIDVWFYDDADGWAWQSMVGTRSDITIVE